MVRASILVINCRRRSLQQRRSATGYTDNLASEMKIKKAVITAAGQNQRVASAADPHRPGRRREVRPQHPGGTGPDAPRSRKSASWSGPATRTATRRPPASMRGRSASSSSREPLGYGHAVWCAREFAGGEPFLHLVGDHLYVTRRREVLRRAPGGRRRSGRVLRLGRAAHARKPAAAFRHGGRPPAARPQGLYRVETVIEKPTPTEAEQRLMVPGHARRLLPLLLRHPRADAYGDGASGPNGQVRRTCYSLGRACRTGAPRAIPGAGRRPTAATISARATACSLRSWRWR